jgi:hypothetical protein
MSPKEFQRVKVIENAADGRLSVREAAVDGRWDGGRQAAAGGNRYTVPRSLRWVSRTDVRWGHDSARPLPGQDPTLLIHQISRWAHIRTGSGPTPRQQARSGRPS